MTQTRPPKHVVLYADDDEDDLQLVNESFADQAPNVEVITFNSGESVVSWLENLGQFDPSPCLIILDINMPRMNGKETLLAIRKMPRYQDVPIVLFTTSSFNSDSAFAARHGAGFITKPLDVAQMAAITHEFVEHCSDEVKKNIREQFRSDRK